MDRDENGDPNPGGFRVFHIHGAAYHFYDPVETANFRAQRNENVSPNLLYKDLRMVREFLDDQSQPHPDDCIFNQFIIQSGHDKNRENLPTAHEITAIIRNEFLALFLRIFL